MPSIQRPPSAYAHEGCEQTVEQLREQLHARLKDRRSEVEEMTLARVRAIADSADAVDPNYAEGLRSAVSAAFGYVLDVVRHGGDEQQRPPTVLLEQARMAAHNGVTLETVLRRCIAGYTLIGDVVVEEVEGLGASGGNVLSRVMRINADLFDRLLTAVTDEYRREAQAQSRTAEQRRAEHVERLLRGESLDTSAVQYDFDINHLGAVAYGRNAAEAIRRLSGVLDGSLLRIQRDDDTIWAWFGAPRLPAALRLERLAGADWPEQTYLAVGEPGRRFAGWCLTHRQAAAALPVARRGTAPIVRYVDVALLASILQDDLLSNSLRRQYIEPLECERDGGEAAKRTLRAYFSSGRNVSSTAAALTVSRRTVSNRLRIVEERLGRPLESIALEIEAALRLDRLAVTSAKRTV